MKVCVLGLRGFPRVMGGVEAHCEHLFPILKQFRPNDSFTVIARSGYVAARDFEYRGVRIVALGHAVDRRLETITNAIYGVLYARFVLHAELLHVQGIGPALIIPLAKALGMRVVTTYHSKNYEHTKWNWLARIFLRTGEWFAVCLGDRLISVSKSLEQDLKRRFPRAAHKIFFIPNGAGHAIHLDDRQPADEILSKYRLPTGRYIVSVGRLVPEKALHDLIEAFEPAHLDCKLAIVGEADHPDDYSTGLRAHASDRIVFTGFVPRDTAKTLLQHASLFVLPSRNEGLPIAALEAIAAGTPVLLSDIEPNRDLGLAPHNYFRVGDVRHLRSKLARDHAAYRVNSDAVLAAYDWNAIGADTAKVYSSIQETIARSRSPRAPATA